jgi:hypothetical protein
MKKILISFLSVQIYAMARTRHTDKKENEIFHKYKENPEGNGCKVIYDY